ncbi:MAG TPA: serine/threonine-protein kinase [Gemmatimonadaceae bacterium]
MFCRNCGTNLADDAAFCANCGSPTETSAGGAVATATDPTVAPSTFAEATGGHTDDQLLQMVKNELGRDYRIEKELGRGGMAVVYKGVETALERVVAIKVVPPESANAGQAAERFRREARLAASLDHANIIPVYRVGQAGPLHYMAMKFVEGRAVDAIIEAQGPLSIPVATAILKYSAAGLAFAHEKKIVHRDIKGANILVDKDGRVMVSDFGIARALEEVSLTASGMMIGTPYFMSPEQCGGQKVSPQSDQYSLGIMGFQLLTGELPFLADSMVGVIQHHYMTPVPDITQVRQDVPKELLDVIYCALNKAPEDRFATTKDMAMALENVPLTDAQRAEAEEHLKLLSMGQAIPKVRTGTLPPLTLTISGPGPVVHHRPASTPRARPMEQAAPVRRKKKKNKKKIYTALSVMGLFGITAAGLGYNEYAKQKAARETFVRDSVATAKHVADSIAAVTAPGRVIFTGIPNGGQVVFNNKSLTNGEEISAPPGTSAATADAPGKQHLIFNVTVTPGKTDTIAVTMVDAVPAATQLAGPGSQAPSGPVPTEKVRIRVNPLRAVIYLDDSNQSIGTGSAFKDITIGKHTLRFEAAGCPSSSVTIDVKKNMPPVLQTIDGCQ